MAHVPKWKKSRVEDLANLLINNPVIGVIDIGGIPASQLQQIRSGLPTGSHLVVTKNTLIRLALARAAKERKNIEKLEEALDGQRGIITADMNPFKLFRAMESTKTKAPAKGGEVAPEDIVILEGDTPFKPGPIVGELQKAGFPAAIERGKVVIKKDKTLVKKGDRIPREVAKLLARLEIYPMTVGLNLLAGFEDGMIYLREVLDVDVDQFLKDMGMASQQAFNLAMFTGYPTDLTIRPLLQNAHQNGFNLAFNLNFPTSETIELMLSKAQGQALSLKSHLPEDKTEGTEGKENVPKKEGQEEKKEEGTAEEPSSDKS
ncbi:MAG: 50S ribosomal protein L10 [Thermoplasmata archaeon]|nr:MAG: 50S ribosomal protein L10 [Thermoplasmata archaeon]